MVSKNFMSMKVAVVCLGFTLCSLAVSAAAAHSVAFVILTFENEVPAVRVGALENLIYNDSNSANNLLIENSNGQVSIEPGSDQSSGIYGPFEVERTRAPGCGDFVGWVKRGSGLVLSDPSFELSTYDHWVFVLPSLDCSWEIWFVPCCEYASIPSTILNHRDSAAYYAKALGYYLGLSPAETQSDWRGDHSIMGRSADSGTFNLPHRDQLGWYDDYPENLIQVKREGQYGLNPMQNAYTPSTLQGIRILKADDSSNYYLSYNTDHPIMSPSNFYRDQVSLHRHSGQGDPILIKSLDAGDEFYDDVNGIIIGVQEIGSVATVDVTLQNAPHVSDIAFEFQLDQGQTEIPQNGSVGGTGLDPNQLSLTYHLVEPPQSGTLTLSDNGAFKYTPNADATNDAFTFEASNGQFFSQLGTASIRLIQQPAQEQTPRDEDTVDPARSLDGPTNPSTPQSNTEPEGTGGSSGGSMDWMFCLLFVGLALKALRSRRWSL